MTVIYGSSVANGTLTNACNMSSTTGGTETSKAMTYTGSNTYAEIWSQGGSTTGFSSIQAPTGHGWVFTPGAGSFATGNWSGSITLNCAFVPVDITLRFYKYTGSYTSIGSIVKSSGFSAAKTTYSFTATSMSSVSFGASDMVYVDLWWHDNSSQINGDNPTVYESNSGTAGVASDMQITTSTFTPSGTQTQQDLKTRLLLLASQTKDLHTRLRLTIPPLRDLSSRLRLASLNTLDLATRLIFSVPVAGPYSVQIDGVPVTVIAGTLTIDSTIGKRSTAAFTVLADNNTHYQQYQQVAIYDQYSALIFSGYITQPVEKKPGFPPLIETQIQCTDQHWLADKRVVAASYQNTTHASIVSSLVDTILSQEGVTVGAIVENETTIATFYPNINVYPATTLYPLADPAMDSIPTVSFAYCTVAAAMDALTTAASVSGVPYWWAIDQYKQLWFAPYTYNTGSAVVDGTQIEQVGSPPQVTRQNPTYRNSQYLTGVVVLTTTQVETRMGDGNTQSFTMGYQLAQMPTIKVDGTAKAVGVKGTTGKDWYWAAGDAVVVQDQSETALTSSNTLTVTYIGQYSTVIQSSDGAQVSYQQALDGTTGIVEEVEQDITTTSLQGGFAKASALLTRYAQQGMQLQFTTLTTGYVPGELVTVNLPDFGILDTQMLIEEVSASDQTDGINIWYTVKAIAGPYDVQWQDFFKAILAPQQNSNNISIGISGTLSLVQSFTATGTHTASLTTTVYACPLPGSGLYPSATLYPC